MMDLDGQTLTNEALQICDKLNINPDSILDK